MRTAITKSVHPRHQTLKPEDRLLNKTWADIARTEEAVLNAATEVVEAVPAPVDVIDGALAFAAKTLKAQREALVPLLESVTPRMATGRSVPTVADTVASAYGLAERVLETQRKALRGMIETVTPPLAKHVRTGEWRLGDAEARRGRRPVRAVAAQEDIESARLGRSHSSRASRGLTRGARSPSATVTATRSTAVRRCSPTSRHWNRSTTLRPPLKATFDRMVPGPADVPMITPAQVERLADAAFLTDPDGTIAVWNRAATELLGHPASRAVGGRCAVLLEGVKMHGAPVCTHPCLMVQGLLPDETKLAQLSLCQRSPEYGGAPCRRRAPQSQRRGYRSVPGRNPHAPASASPRRSQ